MDVVESGGGRNGETSVTADMSEYLTGSVGGANDECNVDEGAAGCHKRPGL